MKKAMNINTARLTLKPPTKEDLADLINEINHWEIAKWLCRIPYPYTEKDAQGWLKVCAKNALNLNIFRNNKLIGGVGLTKSEDGYHELGYWLGQNHWGRGYAFEAAEALLNHAKHECGIDKIKAGYLEGNGASVHILIKLGFHKPLTTEAVYSCSMEKGVSCTMLQKT